MKNSFKTLLFAAIFTIAGSIAAFCQSNVKVYPTHWWVGMKNPKLQLLVYAPNVARGITGAIERMHRLLTQREGKAPLLLMTGGAGWKVAPALDAPHELVEGLIFDGLLAFKPASY